MLEGKSFVVCHGGIVAAKLITSHKGAVQFAVSAQTTAVVATREICADNKLAAIKAAKRLQIPIVDVQVSSVSDSAIL